MKSEQGLWAKVVPALTILLMVTLVGIAVFSVSSGAKQFSGEAMAGDVVMLASIFQSIHKDCRILSFDYQRNPINFLTVGTFAGSEVGSMNLGYPDKWQGPYLEDNLAMQGKEYEIVRTDAGYFIVPGQDVKLPDGKIVGKDIIFDEHADIPSLIKEGGSLNFKGKPLAASISVGKSGAIDLLKIEKDMIALE